MKIENPALTAFLAAWPAEVVVAEVWIRRRDTGFELRHRADVATPEEQLEETELGALRTLAQFTAGGAFRPLKAAPTLRRGWRVRLRRDHELAEALDHLYPGFLADWWAAQQASPPVTHYREFTSRQTGMYRVTQMLTDDQAARVIRVGCRARFCLKRRLWTVPGLEPDLPEDKSIVPCLEPCAVLLEFARKAARIEQAQTVPLPVEDVATVVAALGMELERTRDDGREADFSDPLNRRRVQLLLERLTPSLLVPGQEHG